MWANIPNTHTNRETSVSKGGIQSCARRWTERHRQRAKERGAERTRERSRGRAVFKKKRQVASLGTSTARPRREFLKKSKKKRVSEKFEAKKNEDLTHQYSWSRRYPGNVTTHNRMPECQKIKRSMCDTSATHFHSSVCKNLESPVA